MKTLIAASLLLLIASAAPQPVIPSVAVGKWKVVRAYDTETPTDLDQHQDSQIQKLKFELTPDTLNICGKTIPIKSITLTVSTLDEFATWYRLGADQIGLSGQKITDLQINDSERTHACGNFSNPGTHLMFDEQNHFAIEVDNSYYQIRRAH